MPVAPDAAGAFSAMHGRPTFIFSVTYIGDLVMATLVLEAVSRAQPGPVTVVTALGAAPLLSEDPRAHRVAVIRSSRPLGWRIEVLRQLLAVRRSNGFCLNLEVYPPRWRFVRRVCALARISASHIDLPSLREDERRAVQGLRLRRAHRAEYYAAAVGGQAPVRLEPTATATQRVAGLLRTVPSGRRVVVLHPGSTDPLRRAPAGLLAAVVRRVADATPIVAIVIGTSSEHAIADRVKAHLGTEPLVVDWLGALSLPELLALLTAANLFVGGDSGPLKLAEAAGTPTLSFWNVSSPAFAGPRGRHHRTFSFSVDQDTAATAAVRLIADVERDRRRAEG